MTDVDLLTRAGRLLYGARWRLDLGRDLEVSERTVRRWASRSQDVPAGVWPQVAHLLRGKGACCHALADKIEPA